MSPCIFTGENDARKAVELFCIFKINIVGSNFKTQKILNSSWKNCELPQTYDFLLIGLKPGLHEPQLAVEVRVNQALKIIRYLKFLFFAITKLKVCLKECGSKEKLFNLRQSAMFIALAMQQHMHENFFFLINSCKSEMLLTD